MSLVGFIGDVVGNDGNLVGMDAVARDADGTLCRYPYAGGPARALNDSDADYVRDVPEQLAQRWAPGDVVWFAGRKLITLSGLDPVLRNFSASWVVTPQAHRLWVGKPDALRIWRDDMANKLSVQLYRYLFDQREKNAGGAELAFDLYLAIENVASERRSLTAAIYYFETHEPEAFDFEKERAILSGAFPSEAAFQRKFDRQREWLKQERFTTTPAEIGVEEVFDRFFESSWHSFHKYSWTGQETTHNSILHAKKYILEHTTVGQDA